MVDNAMNDLKLINHPDRKAVMGEAHARPSLQINLPSSILHLAFRCEKSALESLFELPEAGKTNKPNQPRHRILTHGKMHIKIEGHSEFTTFMVVAPGAMSDEDLWDAIQELLPLEALEIIVQLKLRVFNNASAMVKSLGTGDRIFGGTMVGEMDVRTSYQLRENDSICFSINGKGSNPEELGRRIQRLIEMETYRTMCLLGLPLARSISQELYMLEAELEELMARLNATNPDDGEGYEAIFTTINQLSDRSNILKAQTRFRFAASRAYFDLVEQRLTSLQEEKFGDLQTITGFVKARLIPSMATIESTGRRLHTLNDDLTRALALLRTRIDLNLNKGNQAVLKSMDSRHLQQLRVSQAVEGLSAIAITYYSVGLLSYLYKAAWKNFDLPLSDGMATALSVPLVMAIVGFGLHRMKKHWDS